MAYMNMKDSIKRAQNKLVCSAERENFRTKCKKSTIITALTAIMMMVVTPAAIHSMYIGEVINAWKK